MPASARIRGVDHLSMDHANNPPMQRTTTLRRDWTVSIGPHRQQNLGLSQTPPQHSHPPCLLRRLLNAPGAATAGRSASAPWGDPKKVSVAHVQARTEKAEFKKVAEESKSRTSFSPPSEQIITTANLANTLGEAEVARRLVRTMVAALQK